MTEIERIKRYIERTGATMSKAYEINFAELVVIKNSLTATDAVALAFEYGYAKACRAAKAEQRKAVKA